MSILANSLVEFLNGSRTLWNTEESLSNGIYYFFKAIDPTFQHITDYKTQLHDDVIQELKIYKGIDNNEDRKNFRFDTNGNYVIYQPFGSQCKPDVLIINDHDHFFFEHKSSKTSTIMWNSSYPVSCGCYIYHNKVDKYSTYFTHETMITDDVIRIFDSFGREYASMVDDKYNTSLQDLGVEWSIYDRKMFNGNTRFGKKNVAKDIDREQKSLKTIRNNY